MAISWNARKADPLDEGKRPDQAINTGIAPDQRRTAVQDRDEGQCADKGRDPEDREEGGGGERLGHQLAKGQQEDNDKGRMNEPAMQQRIGEEAEQFIGPEIPVGQHPFPDIVAHRVIGQRRDAPADPALPAEYSGGGKLEHHLQPRDQDRQGHHGGRDHIEGG